MADAKKPQQGQGGKDAPTAHICKGEGCKRSPEKFGFCLEHYEMYMAGVLRGDGRKPIDFDEKNRLFQQKQQKKQRAA